ncbi:MAG TPA: tRNA (adenosine(37)-N6)-threonylcarbamoyltransferase complex dimerization subunit type 1 TsaB [Pyrinomonadaceae bacterium]
MEGSLLTLAVDTSTERRSVALVRGGRVLSESESDLREGGSANLLADVDRVLAAAGVRLREVGLFAAAVGPGSFTGLRSGLATVKGLALTTARPAVGVQTLHAVAYGARPARRLVALIPAGRGEVFAQLLSVTEGGRVGELEGPAHMPPALLVEKVRGFGGGVKWVGGGALKYFELIKEGAAAAGLGLARDAAGEDAPEGSWAVSGGDTALARGVAALANEKYAAGGVWGAESLGAVYVRPSDAELKG